MYILDIYLNFLNEGYSTTTSKRTRSQKTKSTAGAIVLSLGKKQNDSIYKKMMMYKKLYRTAKDQLNRKYKTKAMTMARQKASIYK
jgi:hypothetical protein